MAGSSELAGMVEVEGGGEAVTPAEVVEDFKAAIECFLRVKPRPDDAGVKAARAAAGS